MGHLTRIVPTQTIAEVLRQTGVKVLGSCVTLEDVNVGEFHLQLACSILLSTITRFVLYFSRDLRMMMSRRTLPVARGGKDFPRNGSRFKSLAHISKLPSPVNCERT